MQDIEYLRQLAQVQKTQIQQVLRVLSLNCKELEALKAIRRLQQTLALLQELQRKAQVSVASPDAADATKPSRDPQRGHGPTAQPNLPRVSETYRLDEMDRACPSCGGALEPLEGQFERYAAKVAPRELGSGAPKIVSVQRTLRAHRGW